MTWKGGDAGVWLWGKEGGGGLGCRRNPGVNLCSGRGEGEKWMGSSCVRAV